MAWSKTLTRTTKPEPYDAVDFCGVCGIETFVARRGVGDVLLMEHAAREHLRTYHRLRFWAWCRLGERTSRPWRWLVAGFFT